MTVDRLWCRTAGCKLVWELRIGHERSLQVVNVNKIACVCVCFVIAGTLFIRHLNVLRNRFPMRDWHSILR